MICHQAALIADFISTLGWFYLGTGIVWALVISIYAGRRVWERTPWARRKREREDAERQARIRAAMDRYFGGRS